MHPASSSGRLQLLQRGIAAAAAAAAGDDDVQLVVRSPEAANSLNSQ